MVGENNNPLHINIYFTHNSNIVKLPQKGCLNTTTKTYGDLYIILNYTYDEPFSILEKNRCKNGILFNIMCSILEYIYNTQLDFLFLDETIG